MITRKEYAQRRLRPPLRRTAIATALAFVASVQDGHALTQQAQGIARCEAWVNNACAFTQPAPFKFDKLNFTEMDLCKAEVSVSVKQIDFASADGGQGFVKSLKLAGVELLDATVYPAEAYVAVHYPHCDDMFNIFPPYGNGVVGADSRMSVKAIITSDTVPVEIQYGWLGPHSDLAVCSMGGFSFSGYAEVNVFIEAQDKAGCPGWNESSQTACFGNGECQCAANDVTPRICTCRPGFAAPDCAVCESTFFGVGCTQPCDTCLNNGHCDSGEGGTGKCICTEGFDPATRCATCLPGFYGKHCLKCPDCNFPHGNCDDGLSGSGRCSCAVGFDAANNCMDCMSNFYGPACAPCKSCIGGFCNHGLRGDGQCVCPEGFSTESRCLECAPGFYGKSCTPCRTCNSHGRCNDTVSGDGQCICDEGYTKESRCSLCDEGWDFNPTTMSCQCAPQHFGLHCLSCPICAPHGHCNSGKDGDGRCICDVGWSDSNNCVGCMGGYYGETCVECRKCGFGRCDDGLRGSGKCNCRRGWSTESDCFDCKEGFFGETCQSCPRDCNNGRCVSGLNGTGECVCHEGWELKGKQPCMTCSEGYIGPNCLLCPGFIESELPCNGHGQCAVVGDAAVCKCDARYSGSGCEIYDFPVMMVVILGSIALSTLGFCMCAMQKLARQPRHYRGPPNHRGSSFSRSDYVEIHDMSDLEYFVSSDTRDWLIPFESLTLQMEVGNGTSGQVFRSLLHSGGGTSVVAVKRLYSPITGQEYFQSFFRREVSILSRLHHPCVVRFYGVSYYNRVLYIVTDFCPTSLSHLIENPNVPGPLDEGYFLKIINQIVGGLAFLHSRNVVHRDLKPANVLITESNDVNICDFGLSRLLDPDMTSMTAEVGTPSYMAPEMATMGGIQLSTKGDVYSFGILLYSTWSRSKPYGDQGMNPFQLMTAVVNGLRPVIPIGCPPALARLMRVCWDANPENRPSFAEIGLILKDPYLLAVPAVDEHTGIPTTSGQGPIYEVGPSLSHSTSSSTIMSAATTVPAIYRRSSKDSSASGGSQVNLTNYGTLPSPRETDSLLRGGAESDDDDNLEPPGNAPNDL